MIYDCQKIIRKKYPELNPLPDINPFLNKKNLVLKNLIIICFGLDKVNISIPSGHCIELLIKYEDYQQSIDLVINTLDEIMNNKIFI